MRMVHKLGLILAAIFLVNVGGAVISFAEEPQAEEVQPAKDVPPAKKPTPPGNLFSVMFRIVGESPLQSDAGSYVVDPNLEACYMYVYQNGIVSIDCRKLGLRYPKLAAKMTWINWDEEQTVSNPN